MNVKDIMTAGVITVDIDETIAETAGILAKHAISAVPVISEGRLVGLVSEGDLIRRVEIGTADRKSSWWLRLLTGDEALEKEYIKSHALRVRDVMTPDVITVTEDTAVADIPAILEKNHIKRVPVVRGDKVVGIVSRANLIQRLAATGAAPLTATTVDDSRIRQQLMDAFASEPWSRHMTNLNVTVNDGVVEFWGMYAEETERDALRVMAEGVPGVERVEDHRVLRRALNYV